MNWGPLGLALFLGPENPDAAPRGRMSLLLRSATCFSAAVIILVSAVPDVCASPLPLRGPLAFASPAAPSLRRSGALLASALILNSESHSAAVPCPCVAADCAVRVLGIVACKPCLFHQARSPPRRPFLCAAPCCPGSRGKEDPWQHVSCSQH